MGRDMRRFKQLLSKQSTSEILDNATNGVLSLIDSDGTPYGVPISYVYDGGSCIYFHSAVNGHKIECIETDSHCSFCVVGQDMMMQKSQNVSTMLLYCVLTSTARQGKKRLNLSGNVERDPDESDPAWSF